MNRLEFYQQHYAATYAPTLQMSREGIRCDRAILNARHEELLTTLDQLRAKLRAQAGEDIFGKKGSLSPAKAKRFFFETLGCSPIWKNVKTKQGKVKRTTIDENAVRTIMRRNKKRPEVVQACNDVLAFRFADARKKFCKPEVVDKDGRIRGSYYFNTLTLRFGSKKNPMESGHNMQNPPRGERRHFIPDEGHIFLERDLSQAESRIVYMLTGDKDLIRAARSHPEDYDDHKQVAQAVLGILHREGLVPSPRFDKLSESDQKLVRFFGKATNHGCVDGSTEVLTRAGWRPVREVDELEEIAVWQEAGGIHFERPKKWNRFRVSTRMALFQANGFEQYLTTNHRMPYTAGAGLRVATPDTLPASARLPRNGFYANGDRHNPDWVRWLVAIQADAHIRRDTKRVIFHFKRQRKIQRIKKLMRRLGITWDQSPVCKDGSTYLYTHARLPKEFAKAKTWGSWLLDFDAESLDAFIDELPRWDGSSQIEKLHSRTVYLSKNRNNVEWAHTILHLRGRSGVIHRTGKIWGVSINRRQYVRAPKPRHLWHSGYVYCPTVSTGFFLMRRNGHISVTGNSNYGETGIMLSITLLELGYVVSPTICDEMLKAKFDLRPAILDVFQRGIRRLIVTEKRLQNPFGHQLDFTVVKKDARAFRQGYMFIPQSTVPMIMNQWGMVPLYHEIRERGWDAKIRNQVHDSLLISVHPEDAYDVATWLGQSLVREVEYADLTVHRKKRAMAIPSTLAVGLNWQDKHEWKRDPSRREFERVVEGLLSNAKAA